VSPEIARRLREIAACARRGETLKAYAERTGQSVYPLYEAKRQGRRAGVLAPHAGGKRRRKTQRKASARTGRFVRAVVSVPEAEPQASAPGVAWRLRLPGGAVLESATPLDAALLERVVAGLGGRA
jgi:hypothetical protein